MLLLRDAAEDRLAVVEVRTAEVRVAEAVRDAAGRELRVTPLTEDACLVEAELRTVEEFRTEGLVPYLVDIPLPLPLDPK